MYILLDAPKSEFSLFAKRLFATNKEIEIVWTKKPCVLGSAFSTSLLVSSPQMNQAPQLQESDLAQGYIHYFAKFGCAQDAEICRLMDALGVLTLEDLELLDEQVVI